MNGARTPQLGGAWVVLLCSAIAYAMCGCNRTASPKPSSAKSPTIASLVPSATDLLISMGAADHLVADSNYDREPQTAKLPRVGDYVSVDWEKLAQLRPDVIITYHSTSDGQNGFSQKAAALGIREANIHFDRLSDLYSAIDQFGKLTNEPDKAAVESNRIRDRLAEVQKRVAGRPPVSALIVTESSGQDFAGRGNYLNDLLELAGGENAIKSSGYVHLDREAIAALRPQVILQLLPDANRTTQQTNRAFWLAFADTPAVRDNRVCQFTQSYMMVAGSHVAEVAEKFAQALYPAHRRSSTTETAP